MWQHPQHGGKKGFDGIALGWKQIVQRSSGVNWQLVESEQCEPHFYYIIQLVSSGESSVAILCLKHLPIFFFTFFSF